jgi:hypothetical protein
MGGHGGFPISRRVVERALPKTASLRPTGRASDAREADLKTEAANAGTVSGGASTVPSGAGRPVDGDMKGFRHFLSEGAPRCPFLIDKEQPHKDKVTTKRLRELMAKLARRMNVDFAWPAHEDATGKNKNLEFWENPAIPSGYTYFLQLVAHDLISTSFPISILEDTTTGTRNTRSAALRLDTIYGGGPMLCPFIYAPDDKSGNTRTELRLGAIAPDPDDPTAKMPLRDIARMAAPASDGVRLEGLTEPVLADPRNDNNAVLSQMVTLFHILHNGILGKLPAAESKLEADTVFEAASDRFLCARGAVTLIYRRIIRKDLLSRILHPEIYKLYEQRAPDFRFLDGDAASPDGDPRVPLEFSNAAFRFGHAMVRPFYRFNERTGPGGFSLARVLRQNSANLPTVMPFSTSWVARWSYFFEIEGSAPNLSRRIGPQFSPDLMHEEFFPPIDESEWFGLAYRDLLGGGFVNLWSAQGLIDEVMKRCPKLIEKSPFLAGDAYRAKLRGFLEEKLNVSKLTSADIDTLLESTPLAFFILFEAAHDPEARGFRLGLLGSIIVAEVIYAAIQRESLIGESCGSLKDALSALSERIYRTNLLSTVPEINSMAELIKFTAEISHKPGFV